MCFCFCSLYCSRGGRIQTHVERVGAVNVNHYTTPLCSTTKIRFAVVVPLPHFRLYKIINRLVFCNTHELRWISPAPLTCIKTTCHLLVNNCEMWYSIRSGIGHHLSCLHTRVHAHSIKTIVTKAGIEPTPVTHFI